MFDPRARVIYAIVAAELALAVVVYSILGLRFEPVPFVGETALALLTIAAGWGARRIGRNSVALWLEATGLTYLSGLAGWTLAFPATVWALPYGDWWLSVADRAIGFDFPALYRATKDWPLYAIYHSFNWQPGLAILIIVWRQLNPWPLVAAFSIAMIVTVVVYPFAPAIGPVGYYGLGPHGAWTPMIEALRDHGVRTIRPDMIVGMVSLPSFHASVGALIVWAVWPLRVVRWPFVALNAAMIFSTIPFGQHYLVDVVGGLAVAALAIVAASRLYQRHEKGE